MDESNTRPNIDLESQIAQPQSSAAAVPSQHGSRTEAWIQSEGSLQQGLFNNTEQQARANMSGETLIQPENATSEGTLPPPGLRGQDVQLVALASQSPPTMSHVLEEATGEKIHTTRTTTGGTSISRISTQRAGSSDDATWNTLAPHEVSPVSPQVQSRNIPIILGRNSIGDDDGQFSRLLDSPVDVEKDGISDGDDDDNGYSLRVIEIPLNGESPAQCVAECHSQTQINHVLAGLGPMGSKTARIYWSVPPAEKKGRGGQKLYQHIERILGHKVQKVPDVLHHSPDVGAINNPMTLRAQWGGVAQSFVMELFQVKESQPQESFPYSPAYRLRKFQAHMQCIEFEQDKLVVLCQSYLQSSEGKHTNLRNWNHLLSDMNWKRSPIFKFLDGSRTRFIKLLLLHFLNTGLDWSHSRIADIKSARLGLACRTLDDTDSHDDAQLQFIRSITEWQKIILANSEILISVCHGLADSVDYMVRRLKWEVDEQTQKERQTSASNTFALTPAWKCLALDIAMSCDEIKKQSTQIFNCEQRRHELYKTHIDAKTSQNAARLTMLAAPFLPASLAVGCLSMQTRFKDLMPFLFDMCGLTFIIGGLAILLFAFIWIWMRARSHGPWRKKTDDAESVKTRYKILRFVSRAVCYSLLFYAFGLASFLTGMLDSIHIGIAMVSGLVSVILGLSIYSLWKII